MSQNSPQKWFNLEEHFFSQVDKQLLDRLRGQMEAEHTAEAIMQVTGINNPALAEAMAVLQVNVDTLAAFRLAPLVAVAWADDRIEENERYAIVTAAEKSGIAADAPAMELLKAWTTQRPAEGLMDAWCDYAKSLSASLAEAHRAALKRETLELVQAVAHASGGVLGFGSVSPLEKAVIARVEAALS